ncbi:hypothetical protein [Vogesella sp. XCS3]|uniref:hypothetical protein n=1 Tax=Vogesella sp. XCS3 TaxID=2877939 RepID=UPI001D0BD12A|nr:hypothetical protein [Vogesella sp. XCS3]UDM18850.1 hypothetical protein LCH97_18440 [Vogesella sp. XCS3]
MIAQHLGLRPLDRLQINDTKEMAEMYFGIRAGRPEELPFFYFQRVVNDRLEVMAPGGYKTVVHPTDVCDIIPGKPVIVRAMPQPVFLDRLKIAAHDRAAPGEECYADAYVLHANKNRWNQVEPYVWFIDERLNATGRPWLAPVHPDDRARLIKVARRTNMPVTSTTSKGNHSADQGQSQEMHYNTLVVRKLIDASVSGNDAAVSQLAEAGVKKLTMATLNRLAPPKFWQYQEV